MNQIISRMLEEERPLIETLSDDDIKAYIVGLRIIGIITKDDFFDLPRMPKKADRFTLPDGLYFNIPFFDDEQLWSMDNKRDLLVVYKLENKSSQCPLSVELKFVNEKEFSIIVRDQSGPKTLKRVLVGREGEKDMYTEYTDYESLKLSNLFAIK